MTLAGIAPVSDASQAHVPHLDMIWIAGGMFHMGSDNHYPKEAPIHRVAVDGF